jgi:hypothetical protein
VGRAHHRPRCGYSTKGHGDGTRRWLLSHYYRRKLLPGGCLAVRLLYDNSQVGHRFITNIVSQRLNKFVH